MSFNLSLCLFLGKLYSRWSGSFMVNEVFSHGAVEIASLDETNVFKIYRQRLKAYYDDENHIKVFVDLK